MLHDMIARDQRDDFWRICSSVIQDHCNGFGCSVSDAIRCACAYVHQALGGGRSNASLLSRYMTMIPRALCHTGRSRHAQKKKARL